MDEDADDSIYETIDQIYQDEEDNYREPVTGDYYIGMAAYDPPYPYAILISLLSAESTIILASRISAKSFFSHNINITNSYLSNYNLYHYAADDEPQIDIMKLVTLEDETYSVLLKTFWLRLVQRRWKKIMQLRKKQISRRCSLTSLETREITGKFPLELRHLVGIQGMMSDLL